MLTLVVTWDSNINVFRWGVHVSQSDNWNVNVRGFLDSLGVGSWVSDNNQSWFLERTGDVVSEVTWGESTGNWGSTSVGGELQDSSLTESSGRTDSDVGSVWNGSNDSGSQDNLFPSLTDVNNVNTIWSGLVNVWLVVDLKKLLVKIF